MQKVVIATPIMQNNPALRSHEGLGHILELIVETLLGEDVHDILVCAIENSHLLALLGNNQIAAKDPAIQIHCVVLEVAHKIVAH